MRLVVISAETADPREIACVHAMLRRGLTRFHLRKPGWSEEQLRAWSDAYAPEERLRFVLHGEETLARALGFGGAHWRDDASAPKSFAGAPLTETRGPREARF